uniref:Uncharacterized protein n=1 Tax=Oryza nivara TaxID=4536 RepID=A0A0E0I1Y1_ORYNI
MPAAAAAHHLAGVVAAFLLAVLLHVHLAAGEDEPPPWYLCDPYSASGRYSENSTFQANVNRLSATLPRNTSSSPAMYATGAAGDVPDKVYGYALCRGDVADAHACERCVAAALRDAPRVCPLAKDALVFHDLCQLRYSNRNFLLDDDYYVATYSLQRSSRLVSAPAPAAVAAFDAAVAMLANATAEYAAAANTSRRGGRTGGGVFGVWCNLRYEVFPFFSGRPLLHLPAFVEAPPPATSAAATRRGEKKRNKTGIVLAIVMPTIAAMLLIVVAYFCCWRRRRPEEQTFLPFFLFIFVQTTSIGSDDIQSIDSLLLDLSTLRAATDDFAETKMIGRGGFGMVYKGVLPEGQEVAVKRLCQCSGQGIEELKSELVLVAKLYHKNLVRLIDIDKNIELDWGKRFKIINGIAQGLQYLHEDSRLKIVHRDLKASNILLDFDYNPKISDFGLAKIFDGDQSKDITHRIAGTYGYMAPEYAMRGHYSVKLDVFSFGVLVLEIVTGRRNSGSYDSGQDLDLLNHVWGHWTRGNVVELIDPSLGNHPPIEQMLKCIHIGLLCVQKRPASRPTISSVNIMLSSNTVRLPSLSRPAFCIQDVSAIALLLALLHGPLAEAQPLPWQLCNATAGNYTEGSAYQANMRALASALPGNASSSRALFAEGAAGTAPDVVYAVALCRGDTNASSCAACLAAAFDTAQQLCAFNRRATLFNDPCILRYSDQDILANVTDNRGMFVAWNYNNVSTGRMAVFDATSGQLVNTSGDYASAVYDAFSGMLVNATADYAAKDSVRRFGTGEMGFNVFDSPYHNIFSLAQCTPDMSEADCRSCLGDIIRKVTPKYFVGKPGGRVFGVRCNFRFEAYEFFSGRPLLQLSGLPPSPPGLRPAASGRNKPGTQILVIILPLVAISSVAAISICMWNIRKKRRWRRAENLSAPDTAEDFESIKSTLLSLSSLQVATDNFDENKKLGEGGFGAVYKGLLSGQEVAVKRLAKGSSQGLEELKNELVLVAKLHHRNLVRLVGFCLEEGERMLVYEYMPNKSLDFFLFEGVARGLQYLHQDSRKKIVHRDMKASNILLDIDMNPKIGDFGLARLFGQDQTRDVTNCIVGTFGYMSPEYVMRGQYSTKSDVFSFGVLIIEIVTGQRNNRPYLFEQNEDIISTVSIPASSYSTMWYYLRLQVWRRWSDGTVAKMIDHSLGKNYPEAEVLKCINIGLLCLQENPVNRPTMADIMVLLNSNASSSIPAPAARPTFSFDGSSRYSQTITQLSASEIHGSKPPIQKPAYHALYSCCRIEQGRLKNELVLVAKLQHKNLVRLVDVCLEEHDKMVIYEYMPNRSLDTILFGSFSIAKISAVQLYKCTTQVPHANHASSLLDWGRRLKIIHGIARHLQYLHEESRLKIIYRDLKTSK